MIMNTFLKSPVLFAVMSFIAPTLLCAQTVINDISVKACGALGNGTNDDTAAFQAAIAAAQASQTNNGIYVPSGKYVISASLTLYQMEMIGKFAGGWPADTMPMPTLLIRHYNEPAIIMQDGASIHGIAVEYDQGSPASSVAPAVSLQGEGVTLSSFRIEYPYDGISTPSTSTPNRARLSDIFIVGPVHMGVQISKVYDFVQCHHIEVWCPTTFSTGPGYSFGMINGGSFNGLTAFQCTPAFQISTDTNAGGGNFTGDLVDCSADASTTGINIAGDHQIKVTAGDWDCENYGVIINGTNARVTIVGGKWHANSAQCIQAPLAKNVIVSGCMFYQSVNEPNPLVWITSCTTATVDSCQFLTGNGLQLDSQVQRAVITGNSFESGVIVNNMTSTNKIVANNLMP
jgi:hypothetical protein